MGTRAANGVYDEETQVIHIVRALKTVAVLGAHSDEKRPAWYVPAYLLAQGIRCIPVNPRFEGHTIYGEPCLAELAEIDEPVDLVDVFRPSEAVPLHVDDILHMRPLPKVVWLQSGIRSDEAKGKLEAEGITVIQDRCLLVDHRRYA